MEIESFKQNRLKRHSRETKKKEIVIWLFTDGKAGHVKQSNALVFELDKIFSIKVFEFHENIMGIIRDSFFTRSKYSKYQAILKPDLIIGTGHRTHLPMLLTKLRFGGRSVVIMKPSLPYSLFDFCLVPEHDNPPKRDNVISIIGSLNKVPEGNPRPKEKGLCTFLVGGPSNHYKWSTDQILDEIKKHIDSFDNPKNRFILTTSRRTPADFLRELKEKSFHNLEVFDFSETSTGWLDEILQKSEFAFVTPDSISMVYEALSARCFVSLFMLEPKSIKSRVVKNINFLFQEHYISDSIPGSRKNMFPPKVLPNQAEICAKEIISKLFNDYPLETI